MNEYHQFLSSKALVAETAGIAEPPELHPSMFPYQRDLVRWALRRGRAALFCDCGMGKTFMQLEWARVVSEHTGMPVLILTPLAVAQQTAAEAARFGIAALVSRDGAAHSPITIANYESLHKFSAADYGGVVLDESSIIKAFDGKTRNTVLEMFGRTPFRLACTATPAPNDHMELGNHAEFLGVLTRTEMLATFFCHDGGETQVWRLKGHAERDFWRWVASWSVMLRKPSDLGYSDDGFVLPELSIVEHQIEAGILRGGALFAAEAGTLSEQREARRDTMADRVQTVANLVNGNADQWLVWCELNAEGDALAAAIPDAVQIAGSDDDDDKTARMMGFIAGTHRVLVTKGKIAGFGMNLQNCANMAFVGLTHSYETFYQSIRRCWRFGQTRPVTAHVVSTDLERAVVRNIKRKEAEAMKMAAEMVEHMADLNATDVRGTTRIRADFQESIARGDKWTCHLGDCVEVVGNIPDDSIHYTVFSPPFASLYTYSASDRDMGNCKDDAEFLRHFQFLVKHLYRVTMPGRLLSFHCMNMPTSKERDGYIGIRDFRGDLIRAFQAEGWIYHSEVCIWKDPVTAMQRTKALGLLHKQIRKDSAMNRQGIPDYLVTMRKPGDNPERVAHTAEQFPVELWQRYASPIWVTTRGEDDERFAICVGDARGEHGSIVAGDTLQKESAREDKDERHICPLQLEVIRRALKLWTNPGDLVLSPFTGIGSEGYVALQEGRRFIGAELKPSYWRQACANLEVASKPKVQLELLG